MNQHPCPSCGNPIGMSLKEALARQNRVMPFVTQHEAQKAKFQKWESDLKERDAQIEKSEEALRQRMDKLASDEAALAELMDESERPEIEFEQLRQENQELHKKLESLAEDNRKTAEKSEASLESLRQKLTAEKKKRKAATEEAASARDELSAITESNGKLSRQLIQLQSLHSRTSKRLASAEEEIVSVKRKNMALFTQNASIERTAESLRLTNVKLTADNQRIGQQVSDLRSALAAKKSARSFVSPSFAIADLDLLQALSQEVAELFLPPSEIVSLGSGPLDEDGFDRYLEALGITPYADGCPWIIVGREGWSEDELNELLDDADLDEVRVFSQELFIAGILTTHDPFSLPLEILMKFAEGHPALEYLIEAGFEWPEIILEEDYGEPVYLRGSWERVEESPLYRMGYQVGITHGQPRSKRRSLLKKAYEGEIPEVEDDDYMEEWSLPGRSKRLWRIAHHIAWLIRSRQTIPSMRYAVKDWQDDLDWMEEQFYTTRMRFKWPGV